MFVEKTFQEIIDFIRKFFFTIYLTLFSSKRVLYDIRNKFFVKRYLNPLIFLCVTIIVYLFYSSSLSDVRTFINGYYQVDFIKALSAFKLKFETNSQFETILRSIPIIALFYLYVVLVSKLIVKNINEQLIVRNYFFYWCGVQILIYIILSFSYYFSWQVLKVRLTSVRLMYYSIYLFSYLVPFSISFVSFLSIYKRKKNKFLALFLSVAILFSIDIIYSISNWIDKIGGLHKTPQVIVKGALNSDSLIAQRTDSNRTPSWSSNPPQNFKFDLYIYNGSKNLFILPKDEILQLRYFTKEEYKNFQIDTIVCPPTEAIRNNIFWYNLRIIASEDSLSKEIRLAPNEVKWITVQMIENQENRIFRLENCYPYKVLRFYGFTPDSDFVNERYRWKKVDIEQFVVFQNRFKDENPL